MKLTSSEGFAEGILSRLYRLRATHPPASFGTVPDVVPHARPFLAPGEGPAARLTDFAGQKRLTVLGHSVGSTRSCVTQTSDAVSTPSACARATMRFISLAPRCFSLARIQQ